MKNPFDPYGMNDMTQRWLRAWEDGLRAWDLVPRRRYLEVLEENARLRSRVKALEGRRAADPSGARSPESPADTMQTVFDEMMNAQRRWMTAFGVEPRNDEEN